MPLLSETSTIYELITNREDNFKQHQILYQKLGEMIHDIIITMKQTLRPIVLVFLHGFLGDSRTYHNHIDKFTDNYHVITRSGARKRTRLIVPSCHLYGPVKHQI